MHLKIPSAKWRPLIWSRGRWVFRVLVFPPTVVNTVTSQEARLIRGGDFYWAEVTGGMLHRADTKPPFRLTLEFDDHGKFVAFQYLLQRVRFGRFWKSIVHKDDSFTYTLWRHNVTFCITDISYPLVTDLFRSQRRVSWCCYAFVVSLKKLWKQRVELPVIWDTSTAAHVTTSLSDMMFVLYDVHTGLFCCGSVTRGPI